MAGAGNAALGTVADTVNGKADDGDNTERAFKTPRFGMKLQKLSINGTNSTGKPTLRMSDWSKFKLESKLSKLEIDGRAKTTGKPRLLVGDWSK